MHPEVHCTGWNRTGELPLIGQMLCLWATVDAILGLTVRKTSSFTASEQLTINQNVFWVLFSWAVCFHWKVTHKANPVIKTRWFVFVIGVVVQATLDVHLYNLRPRTVVIVARRYSVCPVRRLLVRFQLVASKFGSIVRKWTFLST